ncbi:hypothetical protein ACSQ67_004198 [Phaseolus vulgaris]
MGCRCEKLMLLCFVIGIWFTGMMDGALAARHLMQTPKPTNFQFPPFPPFLPPLPPLPFPCILPVICPSPPSPPPSTTTVP